MGEDSPRLSSEPQTQANDDEQERQRKTTAVLSEAEKAGISPNIIAIEYQKLVRRRVEQRNFTADKKKPSSSKVDKEELQSLEHID